MNAESSKQLFSIIACTIRRPENHLRSCIAHTGAHISYSLNTDEIPQCPDIFKQEKSVCTVYEVLILPTPSNGFFNEPKCWYYFVYREKKRTSKKTKKNLLFLVSIDINRMHSKHKLCLRVASNVMACRERRTTTNTKCKQVQ